MTAFHVEYLHRNEETGENERLILEAGSDPEAARRQAHQTAYAQHTGARLLEDGKEVARFFWVESTKSLEEVPPGATMAEAIAHARRRLSEQGALAEETSSFLHHFEVKRRSWVANEFYHVIRVGVGDIPGILTGARHHAETEVRRLKAPLSYPAPWREGQRRKFEELLKALEAFPIDAKAYAQQCLDWERLPGALRRHVKDTRHQEYARESMRGKQTTEKQRAMLFRLGIEEPPEDRYEASQLIDRLMQKEESEP